MAAGAGDLVAAVVAAPLLVDTLAAWVDLTVELDVDVVLAGARGRPAPAAPGDRRRMLVRLREGGMAAPVPDVSAETWALFRAVRGKRGDVRGKRGDEPPGDGGAARAMRS